MKGDGRNLYLLEKGSLYNAMGGSAKKIGSAEQNPSELEYTDFQLR